LLALPLTVQRPSNCRVAVQRRKARPELKCVEAGSWSL